MVPEGLTVLGHPIEQSVGTCVAALAAEAEGQNAKQRKANRRLRADLRNLHRYADRLAAGLPEGMLPKDVEVLRDANATMADEVEALKQDRQALLNSTELTAKITMGLGAEVKGLQEECNVAAEDWEIGDYETFSPGTEKRAAVAAEGKRL